MPLTPTHYATIESVQHISFLMLDGEQPVRVDVRTDLLVDIARSQLRPISGYAAAFEEHRKSIEQIASAKYDAGRYQSYANSHVVPVGATDWAHRPAQARASRPEGKA